MSTFDHKTYISPLTWRYGSKEMKFIFSEQHKFELYRKIWIALAQAQFASGLVSKKELDDLKKNEEKIDIDRIEEIEKDTKHDLVAAIREFAEKAKIGGGKIHAGATSMDIVDNADTIRVKEALSLVEEKVKKLLKELSVKIEKYADLPCMAYTHIQPAEPTTLGYRFALYAQDLLIDLEFLKFVQGELKAKGMKGAVGNSASYTSLLEGTGVQASQMEKDVMKKLGLEPLIISTQVSTRKIDYLVLTVIASIGQTFTKFSGDLRILQSPPFGELSEPFGKKQIGSSAMPFKRNPINSEKICSLGRYLTQLPPVALENAALSYLERTLDDSANKRIVMSEAFLVLDEILETSYKLIPNLVVNEKNINRNLLTYAPFSATELILMKCVKLGADRQKMHELLRDIAMKAWSDVESGKINSMNELLTSNKKIREYLKENEIQKLLNVSHHVGDAPKRAKALVYKIKKTLNEK